MSAVPLVLESVRLRLGERVLVDRLDVEVAPGECVTLMGPSGCGKSTLLAYVAGSLDPAFDVSGRILIGGEDVTPLPPERRRIGIQFQDDLLFPHLTVGGNLAFALAQRVSGRRERRARVDAALAEADLAGFADRDPSTLSGGQRARVALMRALVSEPRALLLDEPFGRLDAQLRDEVRRFVFDHAGERAIAMLLVTHDEADARAAGGRVLRFRDNGRVEG